MSTKMKLVFIGLLSVVALTAGDDWSKNKKSHRQVSGEAPEGAHQN